MKYTDKRVEKQIEKFNEEIKKKKKTSKIKMDSFTKLKINKKKNPVIFEEEEKEKKKILMKEEKKKLEKVIIQKKEIKKPELEKKKKISIDLEHLGSQKMIKKRNKVEDSDDDIFDNDDEDDEDKSKKIKTDILNYQKLNKEKKDQELMDKKIEIALQKPIQEEEKAKSIIINEEELNSEDDVTDYENEVNTGKNILLAYYDKFSRKKDKRKILLKHCILRTEEMDLIFKVAKGDFTWVAAKKNF